MDDLPFFLLVVRKKYTNVNGEDSQYTNPIISSTWLNQTVVDYTEDCPSLRNISSFFFHDCSKFMGLRDGPECFSRVIAFFFSSTIYLRKNPRGCLFLMHKHACFDSFSRPLIITNHLSVRTLFSLCIILGSALSLGYHTNIALACLFKFCGIAEYDCVNNQR